MKKLIFFLVSTILASSIFAETFAATVESVTGKVEVQNGSEWVALKAGDSVNKGAVISTGFKSEVQLKIKDSTLKLGPLTRMTVEQLASNGAKDQTQVFIDSGKVSADVKHNAKKVDFKVRSPVATASVRGTSFTMGANGTVSTLSGLVSKGPAESKKPSVSSNSEAQGFVPGDGDSTALTSTSEVSGARGIPVFAGQVSTSDSGTSKSKSPQAVKVALTQGMPGTASSVVATESVSSAPSTAPGSTNTETSSATSVGSNSATVIVNISLN